MGASLTGTLYIDIDFDILFIPPSFCAFSHPLTLSQCVMKQTLWVALTSWTVHNTPYASRLTANPSQGKDLWGNVAPYPKVCFLKPCLLGYLVHYNKNSTWNSPLIFAMDVFVYTNVFWFTFWRTNRKEGMVVEKKKGIIQLQVSHLIFYFFYFTKIMFLLCNASVQFSFVIPILYNYCGCRTVVV